MSFSSLSFCLFNIPYIRGSLFFFSCNSSGLSCPAADFVEDSFFATVKDVLSEQGLFIINLVSRSPSIKEMVISRMRTVRKLTGTRVIFLEHLNSVLVLISIEFANMKYDVGWRDYHLECS